MTLSTTTPLGDFLEEVISSKEVAHTSRSLPERTRDLLRRKEIAVHYDLHGVQQPPTIKAQRIAEISKACPSTGWTLSVLSGARNIFSYLPTATQKSYAKDNSITLFAAGLIPSGQVETKDGKTFLSGKWPYVSGAEYSDVILLAARSGEGASTQIRFYPVKTENVEILDTWNAVGLRATRSNTVVVEAMEVDSSDSCDRAEWLTGDKGRKNNQGAVNSALTFLAPALGAAQLGFSELVRWTKHTDITDYELTLLAGRIRAVELLIHDIAKMAQESAPHAFQPDIDRNAVTATRLLHEASTALKSLGGTSALTETPLSQAIHDLDTAISHVALKYETSAARTFPPTLK